MSNLNHLAAVMSTEAELTEQLVEVLKRQQEALVKTDATGIASAIEVQEELLLPIEGLEQERQRLTKEVWAEIGSRPTEDEQVNLSMLLSHLEKADAEELSSAGGRLRAAISDVMSVNEANRYLIDHSRKFVRETFRIVTNGFSRQLVDHKI